MQEKFNESNVKVEVGKPNNFPGIILDKVGHAIEHQFGAFAIGGICVGYIILHSAKIPDKIEDFEALIEKSIQKINELIRESRETQRDIEDIKRDIERMVDKKQ